jgi:NAD(P)H-flavin reductase/ferredoxin
MTFQISVAGTDYRFPCEPNEAVLDATQRAGLEIPYSCRKGVCGTCKGRVVSGEVRAYSGDALGAAERGAGQVLFCQARPRSNLVIEPRSISKADPFARKTLDARVFRMTKMADDVMLVHLRYPAGQRVRFKAGQYVSILLDDGERRDFSMANPPQESDGVQLHVRLVQGGAFTTYVFEKLKRGDRMRVEAPHGSFVLRESEKPILFVAGSTGFAPIKSMIEDAFTKGIDRDMTLYWGARQRPGLYSDLPDKWAAEHPRFRYIPVISDVAEPGFRHGLVHQAVLEDHPSLAEFQAYVCGVPALIRAARKDFRAAGLPVREFFIDAFTTKADIAAARPK